jgi:hypothetical protein
MKQTQCPICGKESFWEQGGVRNPFFPFCSERCRWVDLAHWLEGRYRIPSEQPISEEGPDSQADTESDSEGR